MVSSDLVAKTLTGIVLHDELFLIGVRFLAVAIVVWICKTGLTRTEDMGSKTGSPRKDRFSSSFAEMPHAEQTEEVSDQFAPEAGKYKYCGLREEPFAKRAKPPVYSLEPLDIPLPPLSAVESEKLADLQGRVSDLAKSKEHRTDPVTLHRFLKAKKWNVRHAEKQLRQAAAHRKQWDIDNVFTHWNLKAYERCLARYWLSGGFIGHGKRGEPVAIERIGRCRWPQLSQKLPWEVLMRIDIVHCLRSLAAIEEDALRRGTPLRGTILVIDLDGFSWDDIQFRGAYLLHRLSQCRDLLLPETVDRILMVRAPSAFASAWAAFKHLLDPATQEKIQIMNPASSLDLLRRFIDDDTIPAFLGGKKEINGDPDCSLLLAPGGVPPSEKISEVLELVADEGAKTSQLADDQVSVGSRALSKESFRALSKESSFAPKSFGRCCCGF